MRPMLVLTLALFLVVPVACSKANPSTQAARDSGRMTDADLKNKIQSSLNADPQLRAANLSVQADANRNWASIAGTVDSETMRMRTIDMAKAAHPGLTIEDKIDVKPRQVTRSEYTPEMARIEVEKARARHETVGSSLDDAWIHSKVVAKLISDKNTPERKINVDVSKGVVTLRGTVDDAEQSREAGKVARETEGVKRVVNQLKVSKS
jgi:osmotically-inducible protein OsmY